MCRKQVKSFHLSIFAAAMLVFPAFPQTFNASISGLVTDSTGAVVPGALVTATSLATAVQTKTTTNEAGLYAIPFLPAGSYDVSAEKSGFRQTLIKNVKLDVAQVRGLDLTLQVGELFQLVEVSGTAAALQTQTSSLSQGIDNTTIKALPLNGRNYLELVVLGAGASPDLRNRASDSFTTNGQRVFQNSLMLDGADNSNHIMGIDTGRLGAVQPSLDALEEFKVLTSNYSAEYGHAAGGIVTAAIKSGTNRLHGSAYDFIRNDVFDANNFFANRARLGRPPLRRNQFGGTIGGPIFRDRTFFFFSYEGLRLVNPQTTTVTVPLPGMADGNFGGVNIYDPLNVVGGVRQQFSNNIIPATRLDPVGKKLAALYPAPTLPGTVNNYAAATPSTDRRDQLDFRADQNFGAAHKLFVRYSRSTRLAVTNGAFANAPGGANQVPRAYSVAAGETFIISHSLVNELRLSYLHNDSNRVSPAPEPLFDQFGFKGVPPLSGLTGLPQISVTGFAALGSPLFAPNLKVNQVSQLSDTLAWVHGNHQFRFGGQLWIEHNFANNSNFARGNFAFTGQFTSRVPGTGTGSSLADLVLGQTQLAQLSTPLVGRFRDHYYAFFANDDWRVTRKLTFNLGLRYEFQTPLVERDNQMGILDVNPSSSGYGTLIPATSGGLFERSFIYPDRNNFAPRVGLAYAITPKTVLRSSFGIFYGGNGYQAISGSGASNPPYSINVQNTSATTAAVSNVVLANGFSADTLAPKNNVANPGGFSLVRNAPISELYQWTMNVERELPGGIVLSVAYVGNGTAHMFGSLNVNQPPLGAGALNPRRPLPAWGNIFAAGSMSHNTYHSLQAKAERRFKNGFSLLSSYTWSHALDDVRTEEDQAGVAENPNNVGAEKGNSSVDVRHRYVTSFVYDVPIGQERGVLGGSRFTRALFQGWTFGGIFAAQTGLPFTPSATPNPSNGTPNVTRPNRVCNGNLPRGSRGVDRWFDVSCFVPQAAFTFGNSGRTVLYYPGVVNLDLTLTKMVRLKEGKSLELRADAFNFTNSTHLNFPTGNILSAAVGTIAFAGAPRQLQLALRLSF